MFKVKNIILRKIPFELILNLMAASSLKFSLRRPAPGIVGKEQCHVFVWYCILAANSPVFLCRALNIFNCNCMRPVSTQPLQPFPLHTHFSRFCFDDIMYSRCCWEVFTPLQCEALFWICSICPPLLLRNSASLSCFFKISTPVAQLLSAVSF